MFTLITNHHAASMRAFTCFILIQSDPPNSLVIGPVVNAVAMFFPDHYRLRNGYCYILAQISLRLTQTPLTTSVSYAEALMLNRCSGVMHLQLSASKTRTPKPPIMAQPEPTSDEGTCRHGHWFNQACQQYRRRY